MSKYQINDEEQQNINNWFVYHAPKSDQLNRYQELRDAGKQLAETILKNCPPSPDRTVAIRKIREAIMVANASIACYE